MGAFGGPIVKNKLFFFVDYQQLRAHQGQTNTLTVPTALQRQGVLTEGSQGAIYDPLSGQPFPNNTIPASRMDPVAQKVQALFPLPNLGGLANNFVTVNTENAPQGDIRIDWQVSRVDHVFGRESAAHKAYTNPSPGNQFIFGGPNSDAMNQDSVIGWDRTLSPTMVNEARVGFNRFNVVDTANSYGVNETDLLGLPNGNIPGLAYTTGIAQFNVSGFSVSGSPGLTGDPG